MYFIIHPISLLNLTRTLKELLNHCYFNISFILMTAATIYADLKQYPKIHVQGNNQNTINCVSKDCPLRECYKMLIR